MDFIAWSKLSRTIRKKENRKKVCGIEVVTRDPKHKSNPEAGQSNLLYLDELAEHGRYICPSAPGQTFSRIDAQGTQANPGRCDPGYAAIS